ncbi:MAG: PilZ domain-containing protein [bacterium]|nr:PilZ domain-containing protein [bacterium]
MFIRHQEKRATTRFRAGLPVQYRYLTKVNNALILDLGEGGLSFTTNDFIPVNTQLFVAILPKDEPLRAGGKVVWVQKMPYGDRYNVGMIFTDINAYNKARIASLEEKMVRETL